MVRSVLTWESPVKSSLTAIDLFCGAGGLSIGLHAAGFETVAAVEIGGDACATYRNAFPGTTLLQQDIRTVDFSQWRGVDLVAGGPPCQPFSTGGLQRGREDARDFLPDFVRAVLQVQPRAFLMENVPGLASFGEYLHDQLEPLMGLYRISGPHVINAADYGVPQSRRRMIVIGCREDRDFHFPAPNLAARVPAGAVLKPRPLGEANPSKIVYCKTPDLRPNPYHGQLFNGGGRAINLGAPAPTILASAGGNKTHFLDCGDHVPVYHRHLRLGGKPRVGELPDARRLTVRESAALQTFPSDYEFIGSRSSQYTQVGNAVPAKLAEALGNALGEHMVARSVRRKLKAA
jgi:DNA (cytosine-5)-methyltransferase 1